MTTSSKLSRSVRILIAGDPLLDAREEAVVDVLLDPPRRHAVVRVPQRHRRRPRARVATRHDVLRRGHGVAERDERLVHADGAGVGDAPAQLLVAQPRERAARDGDAREDGAPVRRPVLERVVHEDQQLRREAPHAPHLVEARRRERLQHAQAVGEVRAVVAEGEVRDVAEEEEAVAGAAEVVARDKDGVGVVDEHHLAGPVDELHAPAPRAAAEVEQPLVAEVVDIDEVEVAREFAAVLGEQLAIGVPLPPERALDVRREARCRGGVGRAPVRSGGVAPRGVAARQARARVGAEPLGLHEDHDVVDDLVAPATHHERARRERHVRGSHAEEVRDRPAGVHAHDSSDGSSSPPLRPSLARR